MNYFWVAKKLGHSQFPYPITPTILELSAGAWLPTKYISQHPLRLSSLVLRFWPTGYVQFSCGLLLKLSWSGSGHVSFGPLFHHCLLPAVCNRMTEGHVRIRQQNGHLKKPRSSGIGNVEFRLAQITYFQYHFNRDKNVILSCLSHYNIQVTCCRT